MFSYYDRVGLQISLAAMERTKFLEIFFLHYTDLRILSFSKLLEEVQNIEQAKKPILLDEFEPMPGMDPKKPLIFEILNKIPNSDGKFLMMYQNLTSAFSVLLDTLTNEAVIPYLIQVIHKGSKPYYCPEPINAEMPKFYESSIKQSLQHLLLALCPQQTAKIFEFANIFCNNDALIENVIDSCCDIDRKGQGLKIKSKVKEEFIAGVELAKGLHTAVTRYPWMDTQLFLWSPSMASKFQEDLYKSGIQIIPMSIRPPNSGITTFFRRKQEKNLNEETIICEIFIKNLRRIQNIIKNLDRLPFMVPMLQVIAILSEWIDWDQQSPTKAIEELAEELLAKDPNQRIILEDFVSRFTSGIGVIRNSSTLRKLSATDDNINTIIEAQDPGNSVRYKFEEKKKRIMDRMKKRQTTFFSGVMNQVQAESTRREESDNQEIICSVSKIQLLENETYYMYAQCHYTNVKFCD